MVDPSTPYHRMTRLSAWCRQCDDLDQATAPAHHRAVGRVLNHRRVMGAEGWVAGQGAGMPGVDRNPDGGRVKRCVVPVKSAPYEHVCDLPISELGPLVSAKFAKPTDRVRRATPISKVLAPYCRGSALVNFFLILAITTNAHSGIRMRASRSEC